MEEEGDCPVYTMYRLLDIRKDGGCTLYNPQTGERFTSRHLREINIEWLATLWERYLELCPERPERREDSASETRSDKRTDIRAFVWSCSLAGRDVPDDRLIRMWQESPVRSTDDPEDGTLYVKCPEEVSAAYSEAKEVAEGFAMGDVVKADGKYILGGEGRNVQMFGKMPENCKIEMTFTADDLKGDFGVIVREGSNLDNFYAVKFEPKFNRLALDRQPRRDSTLHTQVDTERYCPIVAGEKNTLKIIAEGSVLEVYVNDKVAMSARMFDFKEGNFGIYTHNNRVVFEDVRLNVTP